MDFITSFISQTIKNATVYTLAALGILIAGRSGIFNVAGEGIMLASASSGFLCAYLTGSWFLGFAVGILVGCAFGFILTFVHETFKVSQFVVGIALFIIGAGFSDLLYKIIIGVSLVTPTAPPIPVISIPFISGTEILSGFLKQDVIVYFMYVSAFVVWWFFYRTKIGLETRAIGENPKAVDVVGVNVLRRRYLATIIGSAMLGIAGTYMPIVMTKTYCPNIVGGRGFMAIGIAIFASWRPNRAILGGCLFAGIEVMAYHFQLISKNIPYQLFLMLPFFSVLAVMVLFKKHIEYPAGVGQQYSRE